MALDIPAVKNGKVTYKKSCGAYLNGWALNVIFEMLLKRAVITGLVFSSHTSGMVSRDRTRFAMAKKYRKQTPGGHDVCSAPNIGSHPLQLESYEQVTVSEF